VLSMGAEVHALRRADLAIGPQEIF